MSNSLPSYGLIVGKIDALAIHSIAIPSLKLTSPVPGRGSQNRNVLRKKDKDGKPVKVSYNGLSSHRPANVKDELSRPSSTTTIGLSFPSTQLGHQRHVTLRKSKIAHPEGYGKAGWSISRRCGYTPGDTWDLYVWEDGRVVEFHIPQGWTKNE